MNDLYKINMFCHSSMVTWESRDKKILGDYFHMEFLEP